MLARSASLARAEPAIPTHEQQLRSGWDCRALGGARSRIGCRYCLVSVLAHERGSSACLLASGGDGGIGRVCAGQGPDTRPGLRGSTARPARGRVTGGPGE